MIVICYFLNDTDIVKEWMRIEVEESVGKLLCEKIWDFREARQIVNLNIKDETYKYVMCNEM